MKIRSRPRAALAGAAMAVSLASTGCQIQTGGNETNILIGSDPFGEQRKLVADADAALQGGDLARALELYGQARAKLRDRAHDKTASKYERRSSQGLISVSLVGTVRALRPQKKGLEIALAFGEDDMDPEHCPPERHEDCVTEAKALEAEFPTLLLRGRWGLGIHTSFDYDLDSSLSTLAMEIYRQRLPNKGFVSARARISEKKPQPDGMVLLQIKGNTKVLTYESCAKLYTLRIGNTDLDVKQCKDEHLTFQAANFQVRVPAAEAEQITTAPDQIAWLVHDAANLRRAGGNTWDAGKGRVAFVTKNKDRHTF